MENNIPGGQMMVNVNYEWMVSNNVVTEGNLAVEPNQPITGCTREQHKYSVVLALVALSSVMLCIHYRLRW